MNVFHEIPVVLVPVSHAGLFVPHSPSLCGHARFRTPLAGRASAPWRPPHSRAPTHSTHAQSAEAEVADTSRQNSTSRTHEQYLPGGSLAAAAEQERSSRALIVSLWGRPLEEIGR